MKDVARSLRGFGLIIVPITLVCTVLVGGSDLFSFTPRSGLRVVLSAMLNVGFYILILACVLCLLGASALSAERPEVGRSRGLLAVKLYGLHLLSLFLCSLYLIAFRPLVGGLVGVALILLIPGLFATRRLYHRLQSMGTIDISLDQPRGIKTSEVKEAFQKSFQVEMPSTKSDRVVVFLLSVLLIAASYIIFYAVRYGWQDLASNPFTLTLLSILVLILFVWFCLMRRNF